ncbi:MAG: hypothetical protein QM809_10175 [Gordonia sp. (in: high G+C Gram-positive bacteria)]|uniref:hypothetical protein n=1 Tax=Gordonia sp. (in: high G+C Gram-positive bacteria) TaxID=84139 RepID=UPI0039E587B4
MPTSTLPSRSPFLPEDAEPHLTLMAESGFGRDVWYRAMRDGQLPYVVLGGVRYVRRRDVQRLVDAAFEQQAG